MNSEATAPEPPATTSGDHVSSGWIKSRVPAVFGVPVLLLLPLGWLWFRLIDHLRVEWTVNTQYNFGWAIPFLCVYLAWNRWTTARGIGKPAKPENPKNWNMPLSSAVAIALLALLYLPVRLVEEANPEWRLVSWALALIVIGITWFILSHVPSPISPLPVCRLLAFPLLFFLVAVPWPTVLEGPLIQGLTRANAAFTIEILNALGIPAIQHGNLIEVGSGVVGIDEACSGIRSFQATLMLSLFFGEIYALTTLRRLVCVLAGFAFSFLFNVARTTVLTMVAARKGTRAITEWHDPAGITILVGCFVCLWGLAVWLGRQGRFGEVGDKALDEALDKVDDKADEKVDKVGASARETKFRVKFETTSETKSGTKFETKFRWVSWLLLVWLALAEVATEAWYCAHEQRLAAAPVWTVSLPRSNPTYRELPLTDKTRQFLRYDEARNGAWEEPDGTRIQAIYLRWNPGRIAVHLAKSHTPDVCLPAAGREVVDRTEQRFVSVHGLELPFRAYTVREAESVLHVYYCLWEDRATAQKFEATSLTYGNRLAPVLAGRRNSGQRSLELIIRGPADAAAAERVLREQLDRIVVPRGWLMIAGGSA